jgi:uncharacterized protein YbjQ (UPF0145 family)
MRLLHFEAIDAFIATGGGVVQGRVDRRASFVFEYVGKVGSSRSALAMARIPNNMVTSTFELPGYRISRNIGIVRGIVARSRSVVGSIGAGLQTLLGGNITLYTELCEKAREDAYELMVAHAAGKGANAVIGMRYDANEVAQGVTEVLAYGTAVVVEASGT